MELNDIAILARQFRGPERVREGEVQGNERGPFCLCGDKSAHEVLFGVTLLVVKQLALRYTLPRYADDLSMDMIEDILRNFERWEPAKAGYLRWVELRSAVVAQRHSVKEYKNFETEQGYDQLEETYEMAPSNTNPDAAMERALNKALFYDIVKKLPGRYRAALILRNVNGLTYKEIAARIDHLENPNAARQLVSRARQAFVATSKSGYCSDQGE